MKIRSDFVTNSSSCNSILITAVTNNMQRHRIFNEGDFGYWCDTWMPKQENGKLMAYEDETMQSKKEITSVTEFYAYLWITWVDNVIHFYDIDYTVSEEMHASMETPPVNPKELVPIFFFFCGQTDAKTLIQQCKDENILTELQQINLKEYDNPHALEDCVKHILYDFLTPKYNLMHAEEELQELTALTAQTKNITDIHCIDVYFRESCHNDNRDKYYSRLDKALMKYLPQYACSFPADCIENEPVWYQARMRLSKSTILKKISTDDPNYEQIKAKWIALLEKEVFYEDNIEFEDGETLEELVEDALETGRLYHLFPDSISEPSIRHYYISEPKSE